jgi:nitroreductase
MDALECISTRRSIRRFLDLPIDQETTMTIIEAGSLAPSSGNVQDWRFVLVDDKALKKTIGEYSLGQDCVHNAAFLVVVFADSEQTERHYGLRGQKLYSVQNCAAAIENMLLAAHALGVGGVWVGAFDEEKIKTLLNVPQNIRPQAIVAFGYPAEAPVHKIIKDISLITYFNQYGVRVRNVHRLLNDYSIDWQIRINQAHTAFDRIKDKAVAKTKEISEDISAKGDSLLKKYKDKLDSKSRNK